MNDHQECPRPLRRRGKPKKAILCATFQILHRPTASSNGESQIKLTQINYARFDSGLAFQSFLSERQPVAISIKIRAKFQCACQLMAHSANYCDAAARPELGLDRK